MRIIHALITLGSAITSLYIINFICKSDIIIFLNSLPTIMGILLATTLTSLAIILGMIGNDEIAAMKKYGKSKKEDYYKKIVNNLRWDVYFIFIAFIVSSVSRILLTINVHSSSPIYNFIFINMYKGGFLKTS